MKICPFCKTQNLDNAQLCFRCGYHFYPQNNFQQLPNNIPPTYYNTPYIQQNNVYSQNNPYISQNGYIESQQESYKNKAGGVKT